MPRLLQCRRSALTCSVVRGWRTAGQPLALHLRVQSLVYASRLAGSSGDGRSSLPPPPPSVLLRSVGMYPS